MASVQYSTVNVLFPHQNFLNNILFSLAYFTVRIQYIIHIHKISVNKWFMLPTRLLVNSNLQLSFGELKSYTRIFNWEKEQCRTPQGQLYVGLTINVDNYPHELLFCVSSLCFPMALSYSEIQDTLYFIRIGHHICFRFNHLKLRGDTSFINSLSPSKH